MSRSLMSAIVEVRPDLDGFERELRAGVERGGDTMVRELEDAGQEAGDKAGKAAGKAVDDGLKKSSRDWNKTFDKMGKVGAGLSIGVTAPLVMLGKAALDEAEQAQKATAARAQVFESMGGSASAAAQQAAAYADELGRTIAVDNDVIAEVQTKAATFRNLWEDQATGVATFNRSVQAAFDMQAAGFGDASSNIVMIAKAVADPEMAAALKRTGALTSEQAKAVKEMAEGGDVLGAQQYLLEALEAQVGGTAEATKTASQEMAVAWADVQEQIGNELLPLFRDYLLPVVKDLLGWFSGLDDGTKKFIVTAGVLAATLGPALMLIASIGKAIVFLTSVTKLWAAAQTILNFVLTANPVGVIIMAVAALVAAFIWAWNNVDGFREFWEALFASLVDAWNWFWDIGEKALAWVVQAFQQLPGFLTNVGKTIVNALTWPWRTAMNIIIGAINWMIDAWNALEFNVPQIDTPLGTVGGFTIGTPDIGNLPTIPALAAGGVVTKPTIALIGEAGDEAVVPLEKAGQLGGTVYMTVKVEGKGFDERTLAEELDRLARRAAATSNYRRRT